MRIPILGSGFLALLFVGRSRFQAAELRPAEFTSQADPSKTREALKPQDDEEKAISEQFADYGRGLKILQPGVTVAVGPVEIGPPPPPGKTSSEFDDLKNAVCQADAIVSGRAALSRVFFNKGETFLVTTYDFRVDRWLRPQVSGQGTQLRVALAGGETILDGKKTRALGPVTLDLDRPVVLWLRKIKQSSSYSLAGPVGTLTFVDNKVQTAFPNRIAIFQQPETQVGIFTAISNAAATCLTGDLPRQKLPRH